MLKKIQQFLMTDWLSSLTHGQNVAYLYALGGNLTLAVMQTLFKQTSAVLTPFQILYVRSIFLLLISLAVLRKAATSPYVWEPKAFRLVMIRMVCMCSSAITMMYCLKYLPVSTTTTLYNIGPIFIFFVEAIYYKKKLDIISFILTAISFVGVALIVQPEFIFGHSVNSYKIQHFSFYITLMLFSAFGYALNMLLIHILSKAVTPAVNLHQSNIGFLLTSSLLCSFTPNHLESSDISYKLVFQLLAIVVTGYMTQYLIIRANSIKKPSYVMPFGYVSVVAGFLADVFLFKTQFQFLAVVGMIFTSVGLLGEYLKSRDKLTADSAEAKDMQDKQLITKQQSKAAAQIENR